MQFTPVCIHSTPEIALEETLETPDTVRDTPETAMLDAPLIALDTFLTA
jgi:hypothetical protein